MAFFDCFLQTDAMDCGPTCLKMIVNHYKRSVSISYLRDITYTSRDGVSILSLCDAAEKIGFKSSGVKITLKQLKEEAPLPCILHWKQNHFVVLYAVKGKNRIRKETMFYIADPGIGNIVYNWSDLQKHWINTKTNSVDMGVVLLLEPSHEFENFEAAQEKLHSIRFLFRYFIRYKKYFSQLLLGLLLGSTFQLILPFLTQAVVDRGISNKDIDFIYLVLIAQLVLIISKMSVEFIRRWLLLHIGTRINISLISDFFIKLMKLPMHYFDKKLSGDLMQRIEDHERIEDFITTRSLETAFSFFTLVIFGIVLFSYSVKIFFIFLIGSFLYSIWIILFLKKRRQLDFKLFALRSEEYAKTHQLIQGMQEIKLQNAEKRKRWEWEEVQADLFKVNILSLKLEQKQEVGNIFINETKNIIITIVAALAVIKGDMTLGMMMATQYIIGQLALPIEQIAKLTHDYQDAKMSLERINQVHNQKNEACYNSSSFRKLKSANIQVNNLTFQYEGPRSPKIIHDLNLTIPQNKVTAIVGVSGSGKTTLIKLLLKYYDAVKGAISVGGVNIIEMNATYWRNQCGVVMQDGFIFSESIAQNIAASSNEIDKNKLLYAAKTANIHDTIMNMPLKYDTIIGQDGQNLSQGQRQRILIARAVYKNPDFLFLDEATNALDANNEKAILDNLQEFYKGKTVVVVAHRLSTVKSADQIIVLDKGTIAEQGTHAKLTALKGKYYNLVKNQLELGK